jgi:hypothetical protein
MSAMTRTLCLVLALACHAVGAQTPEADGVRADGLIDDADLYRLATCGAPPKGDCAGPVLRWDRPRLTLTVAPSADPVPKGLDLAITAAARHAAGQINSAGAGIWIELVPAGPADITLRPTALPEGALLTETPGFSGPGLMGVGYATVWSDADDVITEAVILISTSIAPQDLTSVVLEELMQSMGFVHDINGPAYEGVSILSQTSNATTTIAGQDAALLRLHYPPD